MVIVILISIALMLLVAWSILQVSGQCSKEEEPLWEVYYYEKGKKQKRIITIHPAVWEVSMRHRGYDVKIISWRNI